jgi:hypothetical protein
LLVPGWMLLLRWDSEDPTYPNRLGLDLLLLVPGWMLLLRWDSEDPTYPNRPWIRPTIPPRILGAFI